MGFLGEKDKASVYSSTPLDRNGTRDSEILLTNLEKKDLVRPPNTTSPDVLSTDNLTGL